MNYPAAELLGILLIPFDYFVSLVSGANESEDRTKCAYFSAIRNWLIAIN